MTVQNPIKIKTVIALTHYTHYLKIAIKRQN